VIHELLHLLPALVGDHLGAHAGLGSHQMHGLAHLQ
jgi:hypothetical protein